MRVKRTVSSLSLPCICSVVQVLNGTVPYCSHLPTGVPGRSPQEADRPSGGCATAKVARVVQFRSRTGCPASDQMVALFITKLAGFDYFNTDSST